MRATASLSSATSRMTTVVRGLLASLLQCNELVAKIDKGRLVVFAAQLEFKETAIKGSASSMSPISRAIWLSLGSWFGQFHRRTLLEGEPYVQVRCPVQVNRLCGGLAARRSSVSRGNTLDRTGVEHRMPGDGQHALLLLQKAHGCTLQTQRLCRSHAPFPLRA